MIGDRISFTRCCLLFILIFLLAIQLFCLPQVEAGTGEPDIQAKAAVLIDESSGRVLFAKNPHQRLPQASTTKMMTCLLVIENGDLDKEVKISKYAAETGESSIWLEEGEVLTREDLLYALMLASANDAAVALAESVAGSEEKFVELMNKRARELKLNNTHFINPHGLDADGHYSSAYDLALLAREGLSNELFSSVVTTMERCVPWSGHPWDRYLYNRNRLLTTYKGARGVKTGYTSNAGLCLVGAAQRGKLKLISAVMNSPNVYDDTQKLLDYGFSKFEAVVVEESKQVPDVKVKKGTKTSVRIMPEREVVVAVLPEEKEQLSFKLEIPDQLEAPVNMGEVVGKGKVFLNGKELTEIDYMAQEAVPRKPPIWTRFFNWLKSIFS
ncbi:MAG: D-alanyl-D-alanine carboxypeptidase family protein [Thermacetogeniaceae bacterium]|jgi:D-alanyl-D-alanine carboxypeptidase (penicillin-binding protein 5/6)